MRTLRVATFNVRHCRGLDDRVDVARIADVIMRTGADLVALQELDRSNERSGRVDQPSELARLTGLKISFFPTVERGESQYGIGLATTEPLDATFFPLPRRDVEEPRGLIGARWRGLSVIATHISNIPDARPAQVEALVAAAERTGGEPTLILGDLNGTGRTLGPLHEAGFTGGPGSPATLAGRFRRKQIDHVLIRGGTIGGCWTIRSRASDHLPLVALVDL